MEKSGRTANGGLTDFTPTGFVRTKPPSKEKRAEMKKEMRAAAEAPPAPAAPADPLAFVDELPAKVRALVDGARASSVQDGNKRYAEGMRRAMRLIAIAVGQLDGESKKRIESLVDQLETEAAVAEKVLRAP